MAKFVVYAHDHWDPEADILYVCTCDTKEVADNIASSLYYKDTGGREDKTGQFDYYVKEEGWIV